MKKFAAFALGFALLLSASPVSGKEDACFRIVAEDDLVCRAGHCPGSFDAGNSVSFRLAPGLSERKLVGPPVTWMDITVLDGEIPVRHLPDSFYIGYAHLAQEGTRYWMIGEYTGGMHCCSRYHFFSRPAPGLPLRYLGRTAGSAQGIDDDPFSCRNGRLYLEDWDTRFHYFHTPYAESLLLFPTHYKLTPASLSVDNGPFRDKYLQLVKDVEADMAAALSKRTARPASILLGKDEGEFFSDELGQLLVKRAILSIYAGEEKKAWKTLNRDVKKYYRSEQGPKRIKAEIRKILAENP